MIITNKLNLPNPIVEAVKADSYDRGDSELSVTDLITPPQITMLTRMYADKLSEDASDRIWLLMGKIIHEILEKGADEPGAISEQRFFTDVAGVSISGQVDRVHKNIIEDYKITSAWAVKDGVKPEWERQLNYYRYLVKANGLPVDGLRINAILRDWSASRVHEPGYPLHNVHVMPVHVWPDDQLETEITRDVIEHIDAIKTLQARPCTDRERWKQGGQQALMKKGRKTAVKLFNDEEQLVKHMAEKELTSEAGYYMEGRPVFYRRCQQYCPVAKYCEQYQEDIAK